MFFLQDLELLEIATQNGIRFGSGSAIERTYCYTGEEQFPDLPLKA